MTVSDRAFRPLCQAPSIRRRRAGLGRDGVRAVFGQRHRDRARRDAVQVVLVRCVELLDLTAHLAQVLLDREDLVDFAAFVHQRAQVGFFAAQVAQARFLVDDRGVDVFRVDRAVLDRAERGKGVERAIEPRGRDLDVSDAPWTAPSVRGLASSSAVTSPPTPRTVDCAWRSAPSTSRTKISMRALLREAVLFCGGRRRSVSIRCAGGALRGLPALVLRCTFDAFLRRRGTRACRHA